MRNYIYSDLSTLNNIEYKEVKRKIRNFNENIEFKTNIVKERTVIDINKINSDERLILDYYKKLINKAGKVRFPNRSSIMSELMNIMPSIHSYHAYTIYKFDIEKFFYKVNPKKFYEIASNFCDFHDYENKFFKKYVATQKELIPGVGLHNSMIEFLGAQFDICIKEQFKEHCIYYARYVDDGILILDEEIPEVNISEKIIKILKKLFGLNVNLNTTKTKCFNKRVDGKIEFEYLGYQFCRNQSQEFRFGIAKSKLKKYQDKINKYVLEYSRSSNVLKQEILDFKIDSLFKRLVYYGNRKNSNISKWQVRGMSDNYKELKRFMNGELEEKKLTKETLKFFEKDVKNAFLRNRIEMPNTIKNKLDNKRYITNFRNNKTILLHSKLGWKYSQLNNCMKNIYNTDTRNKSYKELATEFLKSYL